MRGSTAAGINNSLLPRDCSCVEFAGGHLLVVPSGERPLFGVCWISGSAVWEEASFPGVFGIRLIRYRRGASVVRNMRAVRRTASCGTRRVFGSPPCSKQASTVRKGNSVPETPFYGTEQIFVCAKQPPVVRDAFSEVPGARRSPSVFLRAKEGNSRFLIAYCARFHIFVNGQRKGYEKERPQRSHQGRHQVLLGDQTKTTHRQR